MNLEILGDSMGSHLAVPAKDILRESYNPDDFNSWMDKYLTIFRQSADPQWSEWTALVNAWEMFERRTPWTKVRLFTPCRSLP